MDESINNLNSEEPKETGLVKVEDKPVVDASKSSPEPKAGVVGGENHPQPNRRIIHAQRAELFSGPIPPPDLLEKYNNIIPGGADRILAMAEQQQSHRQFMERTVIEGDVRRADRGLILGFIITLLFGAGGIYLIATGHDLNGLAIIFVPLAGLVGTFIYSQKTRKEERIERSKTISERNAEKSDSESEERKSGLTQRAADRASP
jgi:uncharacterized membrane protein